MSRKFISSELRKQVITRDYSVCRYCGQYVDNPHLDHVYPVSKGGETTIENLVTSCQSCNLKKHAKVGIWPMSSADTKKMREILEENIRLFEENKKINKLTSEADSANKENYELKINGYHYLLSAASIPGILGFLYLLVTGKQDLTAFALLFSFVALFTISYIYRKTNFGN